MMPTQGNRALAPPPREVVGIAQAPRHRCKAVKPRYVKAGEPPLAGSGGGGGSLAAPPPQPRLSRQLRGIMDTGHA